MALSGALFVNAQIRPPEVGTVEITLKNEYIITYDDITRTMTEQEVVDKLYTDFEAEIESERTAIKQVKYNKIELYLRLLQGTDALDDTELDLILTTLENAAPQEIIDYVGQLS